MAGHTHTRTHTGAILVILGLFIVVYCFILIFLMIIVCFYSFLSFFFCGLFGHRCKNGLRVMFLVFLNTVGFFWFWFVIVVRRNILVKASCLVYLFMYHCKSALNHSNQLINMFRNTCRQVNNALNILTQFYDLNVIKSDMGVNLF